MIVRNYMGRKWLNFFQSLLIITAMSGLLALLGWLIAGKSGVVWAFVTGAAALIVSAGLSPWSMVLRMYNARFLRPEQAPALYQTLDLISRRAGLNRNPDLFYIPSHAVNAFSMGNKKRPIITVTDGLLRTLNLRELGAVLAHEISHIRNNDIKIMNMADVVSRMTALLALSGQILLFINLPLIITEGYYISWWIIAVLILAPTISTIMQLALSRTREFDADIDAAMITNDPMGLAQALAKLEYKTPGWLMGILRPGKKTDLPSILRTHPRTKDRIERLISLAEDIKGQEHDHTEPEYLVLPVSTIQALRPRRSRWFQRIRFFE
jgi:heat shock protein HtpX